MPGGKKVTPLFGVFLTIISLYFACSDFNALAAHSAKPFTVVIDPGHGGQDAGAIGKAGGKIIREKEVALAIAKATAKILNNPAYTRPLGRRVKVILTRTRDRYVTLETRSEKGKGADLFLSIHANSDSSHKAQGLEFYFLNNTDDESSLKLQQIENRAAKRSHSKSSLLMRSVIADAVTESSHAAAEILHSSVVDQLRSENVVFQDRGVKQAMLYVLLDAQVPAVLVESFYLSNPVDAALVSDSETRSRLAEGLAKGVLRFLASR